MTRPTLRYWHLSLITVAVLLIHWLCSHCIVNWLGGEVGRVVAQTATATDVPSFQADDGWRRTSHGWERISAWQEDVAVTPALPTTYHFSLAQFWPAAWAATIVMLVLIFSSPGGTGHPAQFHPAQCHPALASADRLASGGSEAAEVDWRAAGGDQVGQHVSRAG